ncbi:phage tail protein [Lacticaseibacillus porcinae]|uniref:phage tail protein n=1 Tax=Lacticaseibacillus porcinae TaxID=1123687 RepID=UPI000F7B1D5F|nr:phage tail protein [Lacticaseibacillus porcinae]
MSYEVDFKNVSTIGLESSPNAEALAGLRANEARYFWNKYKIHFVTEPAAEKPELIAYVNAILSERDLHFAAKPLEVSQNIVDGVKWTHVFYEDGLGINVLYTEAVGGKRAVGIKLSDGMDVPAELVGKFKFAHQKSKLAGVIRGSFFVIKGEY